MLVRDKKSPIFCSEQLTQITISKSIQTPTDKWGKATYFVECPQLCRF